MRRIVLMLAGLVVLTAAIYWQAHRFDFIQFDDADYVYNNRYVHAGFTSSSIQHALRTYAMGNWNPLLWASFYLDSELFDARSGPIHVENALLHLITSILLWRLIYVATGKMNRSWVVAALFLCHPMHVESVAWVSERKDVLSTPILLTAMLVYVWYCRHKPGKSRWLAYLAMLVLFTLSMMVKTMGVTLPAVLLLMDYWPLRRWPEKSWMSLVIEKIPLLLISVTFVVIGSIAQVQTGATVSFAVLSFGDRINNAIVCYVIYTAKLLVPINLAVFYPHPHFRPPGAVFASLILLLMTTWFCYRIRKRFAYAIIGWLWFLGTLVPVIGLMQLGSQAMADRYSYFPSIGFLIVVVWGGSDLMTRMRLARMLPLLGLGIVAMFTALAHQQASYWENSQLLFTHALEVADDSAVAHAVLAQVALEKLDLRKAVDENNLALKHGPYDRAYYGLGMCWMESDPDRACGYFQKAVDMLPRSVLFHAKFAKALLKAGRRDEALAQAQQAVNLDPGDPVAQDQLAQVKLAK